MIYYVDPEKGAAGNDGQSIYAPLSSVSGRTFEPGDTVLFKRGTVIRSALFLSGGSEKGAVTYGAYGTGKNPVVNLAIPAGSPAQWQEALPGLWRFTDPIPSEMCNIVFNDGEAFGNLRWSLEDLKKPGEWTYDRLGYSMQYKEAEARNGSLYLACSGNPAMVYRSIELVVWGSRAAVCAGQYTVIENLTFEKSGVHGFSATQAHHIHIRNCTFRCIGGGVFDREQRVRLGNAVEFWNGASDCVVEHCVFEDIYDSGITHQGNAQSQTPQRLIFRHNLFRRCGLAAYEWRGPSSKDIVFEHNRCMEAGGAFTMQGEPAPRRTEGIESIRACTFVLIWLKEKNLPAGEVYCSIRDNEFWTDAGCEAAIFSTLDPHAYHQFVIDKNEYIQSAAQPLAYIYGKKYRFEDFQTYQMETGQDRNSRLTIIGEKQYAGA